MPEAKQNPVSDGGRRMATESTVNPNGAGLSPSTVSSMSPLSSAAPTGSAAESQGHPAAKKSEGIHFERYYTTPGVDPFDAVEWELRDAVIGNEKGEKVFEQKN